MRHLKHEIHIETVIHFHFRDRLWAPLDKGFRAICVDSIGHTSGAMSKKYLLDLAIYEQNIKCKSRNKIISRHYSFKNPTDSDDSAQELIKTGLNCPGE
jgi:hypothetical protein